MTNLTDLTVGGIPVVGGGGNLPATKGNYYFVDYGAGSDGNSGTLEEPFKTISKAYTAVASNNDDVIILMGNSSHVLSEMLTVSKNRVHFVGMDASGGRLYGQNAKISMGVTTATTDVFAVKDTGVRNSYTNIKFMSSNTLTQHVATFGGGGEYTKFNFCEFYASGKQASDTHAEFVHNIDSPQFFNCTFGSLATAVTGDKIRPAMLLTKATVAAGKVARDSYFEKCQFWKNAGGTTTAMIKGAATDIERKFELYNCMFEANILGSTPAVAIDVANLTQGRISLTGDTCAIGCTKIGTATGIFNCTPERVATATIAIQAT